LVLKFKPESANPRFANLNENLEKYRSGLHIIRSVQCPYTQKNFNAILESARTMFDLEPNLIDLEDVEAIQQSPCAFGTFCVIYNGEVLSHHPISNTRFVNIMKKKIK